MILKTFLRLVAAVAISVSTVSCGTGVRDVSKSDYFKVGGTVKGLLGYGLVLKIASDGVADSLILNKPDSLNGGTGASGAIPFEFSKTIKNGSVFQIDVAQNPRDRSQVCKTNRIRGKVENGSVTNIEVECSIDKFDIGGVVTGLAAGAEIVLQNNGADALRVVADASGSTRFKFDTQWVDAANYQVSVAAPPRKKVCQIFAGAGKVQSADIDNVVVNCVEGFMLGGVVRGLEPGANLSLRVKNAAAQASSVVDATIGHDGRFEFPVAVPDATQYIVSVEDWPRSQTCTALNDVGTVNSQDVTDIAIDCNNSVTSYTVGGHLYGLASGATITLSKNGIEPLTLDKNGTFGFAGRLIQRDAYNISIQTLPLQQSCVLLYGMGTVKTQNVVDIEVNCGRDTQNKGSFVSGPAMSGSHVQHATVRLADGRVLVTGGEYSTGAEILDTKLTAWSPTGAMRSARTGAAAALLRDGRVLVAGGSTTGGILSTAEVYDPLNNGWSDIKPMNAARLSPAIAMLKNGKILVAGGWQSGSGIKSVEIYDAVADTWTTVKPLNVARSGHTATRLADGRVLVVGGWDGTNYHNSAETYDPDNDVWTYTLNLSTARSSHTATLLPDGSVVVIGGYGGNAVGTLSSAEIFSPATNKWVTPINASMLSGRTSHTATLLTSGKILVAGGGGDVQFTAQAYDPDTQLWSPSMTMTDGRMYFHSAALAGDGSLIVTGGYRGVTATNTAYGNLKSTDIFR